MPKAITELLGSDMIDLISKMILVILIPWSVWVTKANFECSTFINKGDRFSREDGILMDRGIADLMYALETRLDDRIDKLPPEEWRATIRDVAADNRRLEMALNQFEKEFTRDFVRWTELPNADR